jgi:hypothetical protein
MMPWKSKNPLLTGHTRRAPLVEIKYTGLFELLFIFNKQFINVLYTCPYLLHS